MSTGEIFVKYFTYFGYGIATTLFLAIIGTIGGLVFGLFLALGRTIKINPNDSLIKKGVKKVTNFICYVYIQVFRGTPMMLQGMIFFLAIPAMIGGDFSWTALGDHVIFNGYLLCGSIVIILNTSAYIGEILRGGINSIDIGQEEGARSLGMSKVQTMLFVVLPQALRNSIPSIGNELIVNIKDSSVLNVIGLTELFGWGKNIINETYNAIGVYVIVALIYLVLTVIFSLILKIIEKKMNGEVVFNINFFKHSGSIYGGNN